MGQANKRGSFEQRKEQALARNKAFESELEKLKSDNPVRKFQKVNGTQKTIIALMTAGLLTVTHRAKDTVSQPVVSQ